MPWKICGVVVGGNSWKNSKSSTWIWLKKKINSPVRLAQQWTTCEALRTVANIYFATHLLNCRKLETNQMRWLSFYRNCTQSDEIKTYCSIVVYCSVSLILCWMCSHQCPSRSCSIPSALRHSTMSLWATFSHQPCTNTEDIGYCDYLGTIHKV